MLICLYRAVCGVIVDRCYKLVHLPFELLNMYTNVFEVLRGPALGAAINEAYIQEVVIGPYNELDAKD